MRWSRALGTALAACLVASGWQVAPVSAANPNLSKPAKQLDRIYLRFSGNSLAMSKMISCQLRGHEDEARALFDLPVGSEEQNEAMNRVFFGYTDCLMNVANMVRSNSRTALGSLAEELIDIDGATVRGTYTTTSGLLGGGTFLWDWHKLTDEQQSDQAMMGNCLVGKYPAKVADVLATKQTSNDERKLFNAMTAEIESCVPVGKSLILNPMVLRVELAIYYYLASRKEGATADV